MYDSSGPKDAIRVERLLAPLELEDVFHILTLLGEVGMLNGPRQPGGERSNWDVGWQV
jgi:hypothetical protein